MTACHRLFAVVVESMAVALQCGRLHRHFITCFIIKDSGTNAHST